MKTKLLICVCILTVLAPTASTTYGCCQNPTASFSWTPDCARPGQLVTFDASASTDPDSSISSYSWDFGDGATGTGMITTHAYSTAGPKTITLTVTDSDCSVGCCPNKSNSCQHTITVGCCPVCDNCHWSGGIVYECGHDAGDTECATDWCIQSVLNSASCDFHAGREGPSRCNTTKILPISPANTELWKRKLINLETPCPGGTVQFVPWKYIYYGCDTCSGILYAISCQLDYCSGIVDQEKPVGHKKQCGGCDYNYYGDSCKCCEQDWPETCDNPLWELCETPKCVKVTFTGLRTCDDCPSPPTEYILTQTDSESCWWFGTYYDGANNWFCAWIVDNANHHSTLELSILGQPWYFRATIESTCQTSFTNNIDYNDCISPAYCGYNGSAAVTWDGVECP